MDGFTGTIPGESSGHTTPNTDQTANGGISIGSIRKPKVKRSETDSKIDFRMLLMLVAAGVAIFSVGSIIWKWNGDPNAILAQAPTPLPYTQTVITPTATLEPTPTEEALLMPTSTPHIIEVTNVQTVTEYISVPYEVTRVVEVFVPAPTVEPTVAPSLAPGVVSICVDASGVKELYVAGVGVVGGGCHSLQVGSGSTFIEVQVNR